MTANVGAIQIKKIDEKRWNSLFLNALNASYRQSMAFEYTKELRSREINTYIFTQDGLDIAGVHYSLIQSAGGIIKVADILSGFVFRHTPDAELLLYMLEHFTNWAKAKKASLARFNPWLPKTISGNETIYTKLFDAALSNLAFHPIQKERHTYWIDLTLSEDEILNRMKKQTRYDVRKGLNSRISTEIVGKADDTLINKFWDLYKNLAVKKQFSMYSEKKFKNEMINLLESDLAKLFVMQFEEEIINFSLAGSIGIGTYLHGAVNPDYKRLDDCPSPGHLAQWKMIIELKKRGLKTYDMGFCPGPVPVKEHPTYNIWRFKYGFGGEHVEFLPLYGKILRPITGRVFKYLRYAQKT